MKARKKSPCGSALPEIVRRSQGGGQIPVQRNLSAILGVADKRPDTATFIGGAALFAMFGHPDDENKAVAEFFKFLTSPKSSISGTRKPVTCRSRRPPMTLQEGRLLQGSATSRNRHQAVDAAAGDWTKGYRLGFYVQIRDVMNREYGKLLQGETDVESAFSTIEESRMTCLSVLPRPWVTRTI